EHLPAAERERERTVLTAAAGRTLTRRGLDDDDVVPPNNARLLGALLYATRLDDFAVLAPGDSDPGPGLRALVASARGAPDPFESLAALTAEGAKSQGGERAPEGGGRCPGRKRPRGRCRPSRSTRCSAAWRAGCESSDTMWPTARISAAGRWSIAPAGSTACCSPETHGCCATPICRRMSS